MAGLYVATDADGRQRLDGREQEWPLPQESGDGWTVGEVVEGDLLLSTPSGLLGNLTELIFRAELVAAADRAVEEDGGGPDQSRVTVASSARLVSPTAWDPSAAAGFALDCAEHVLGDAAETALPDGTSLATAIGRAREWLGEAVDHEESSGGIARVRDVALLWRLRRQGKALGDLAFIELAGDIGAEVDALDDPVWSTVAAARDAVLAAVEAVQHALFPRLSDLESHHYEKRERDLDGVVRFTGGRRMQPSWVPAWTAADDAAERARRAVSDSGDDEVGDAELEWQAELLEKALAGTAAAG